MPELSEIVDRKFVESWDIDEYEVWTDTGWQDVTQLHETVPYEAWEIILENGMRLEAADDHIVFREDLSESFVKDLTVGDLVMTEEGPVSVLSVRSLDREETMYDLTVDSDDHRYYTDGILSHNTVTMSAFLLWSILFNSNYNVAILANKHSTAIEIVDKIKTSYEELPAWLQQGVTSWNKASIELENGSRIISNATSPAAIRGYSFNIVFLDEFGIVPDNIQEEFWKSVFPTISSGKTTKVFIASTPNGMNLFYSIWSKAKKKGQFDTNGNPMWNGFTPIEVHWSGVPGRDEKWREKQIAILGERGFEQEFGCEFLGSSMTLISGSKLQMLEGTQVDPIHETPDGFKFYLPADRSRSYMMVVDTARGAGLDYSAFVVFDVTEAPYKVACTFRNNSVHTIVYPKYIMEAATYYNNCGVLVETNDLGAQIVDILHLDMEYENLISTAARTKQHEISSGFGGAKSQLGVRTTKTVKRLGCSTFKSMVETDQIIINDYDLYSEMTRFSLNRAGSYEAERGNDDLVMCCVLFAWMSAQPYFKDLTNTDIVRNIYRVGTEEMEADMVPFGIIDTGHGHGGQRIGGDLWTDV